MQRETGDQTTFFDMAVANRGGGNRVLDRINELVDFSEAEAILEASYSQLGRPGHRVPVMLRIMILQHLYNLSDPQAEEQLRDRLSFQKFVGLMAQEAVPDETAICRFRERIIGCKLQERLLDILNGQLETAGYLVKRTTLVDATLVESCRKRPPHGAVSKGEAPDPDARYARKYGQRYYGYKAHISADGGNQLICRAKATPANVDDSQVFEELIDPKTRVVYADKAYDSKANKGWLKDHRIANGILKKGATHIKLTAEDQLRNARKSKKRDHVERIFAHLKKWQHFRRVRYLGLVKTQLELTLKAVAYNLRRLVSLAEA
ncbi:MAG: IS5 family transposase [Negativicutes bacterium]|nr:IS5 family transposase [Negativicutes bacterium]